MRFIHLFFAGLFIITCAGSSPDRSFTGSTPAGKEVREFLGISLKDSIDFIRWNLVLSIDRYELKCNYGIGKPNTNGFYDGGKKMNISGELKKQGNAYQLKYWNRTISLTELNGDLLHFRDTNNDLLIGNGGWSYALNSLTPSRSDNVSLIAKLSPLKDSITFLGRTPCGVDGVNKSAQCYKLKWSLVLYVNAAKEPAGYKVKGTGFRNNDGRGTWKIVTGKNGRIIYQLNDENGNDLFYLLKLDEGVLIFTDKDGNLLVGDKDFSYTLNRK